MLCPEFWETIALFMFEESDVWIFG